MIVSCNGRKCTKLFYKTNRITKKYLKICYYLKIHDKTLSYRTIILKNPAVNTKTLEPLQQDKSMPNSKRTMRKCFTTAALSPSKSYPFSR